MNAEARIALGLGLALIVSCPALAQGAPAVPGAPPPPAVQRAGSVEYLNGGAGEEERAAMTAQRGAFALRIVFSQPGGAYAVADHVEVSRGGAKVLGVDKAGPFLMLKLSPGDYAVDASFAGRTERRQVRVGRDGTQLDWRLPEEPRR
ncbi:MAG: hypothetical protein ABIQ06_14515 [Caldimonas sp.]